MTISIQYMHHQFTPQTSLFYNQMINFSMVPPLPTLDRIKATSTRTCNVKLPNMSYLNPRYIFFVSNYLTLMVSCYISIEQIEARISLTISELLYHSYHQILPQYVGIEQMTKQATTHTLPKLSYILQPKIFKYYMSCLEVDIIIRLTMVYQKLLLLN